jgi:hypothetical protein
VNCRIEHEGNGEIMTTFTQQYIVYCQRDYYEAALDTIGAVFDGTLDDYNANHSSIGEAMVNFMLKHHHAVAFEAIATTTPMMPHAHA